MTALSIASVDCGDSQLGDSVSMSNDLLRTFKQVLQWPASSPELLIGSSTPESTNDFPKERRMQLVEIVICSRALGGYRSSNSWEDQILDISLPKLHFRSSVKQPDALHCIAALIHSGLVRAVWCGFAQKIRHNAVITMQWSPPNALEKRRDRETAPYGPVTKKRTPRY
jgi:hypothetical protein